MPQTVYIIAGPTASGKSGLGLALAQHLGGVVINADSMQVYGSLEILTARPSAADMALLPHHLYGFINDPNEAFSVAKWREAALGKIEEAFVANNVPVVVGGTGLYLKALLEGLTEIPETDPKIRESLRQKSETSKGLLTLYDTLMIEDPVAHERLKPNDAQRIVRALEVVRSTGKPLHEWQSMPSTPLPYNTKIILLNPSRNDVVARSQKRLKKMFQEGAIKEVEALLEEGVKEDNPLKKAVGVREIEAYLQGNSSLEQALEKSFIATRQYIKRQQTWFTHQLKPDIILDKCYEEEDVLPLLKEL